MPRHRSIGLLAGMALAVLVAGTALAKEGEDSAVIALDKPNDPHAGAPIKVGVLITRASTGSAFRGEDVTFQLVKDGGIGLVTAHATEVTQGHYVATVTLPQEGAWTVVVTAVGQERTETFHAGVVQMGAPLATPTPSSPAAQSAPAWMLILGLVALALAAGAASWILTLRRRSAPAADRA